MTSDEVASHELLLATVPPSVLQSFRERLLGPLLAYDDRHRAELLPTLREFLACSGSWNACAAKMYARQHRALPDQADRGADRARSVLPG